MARRVLCTIRRTGSWSGRWGRPASGRSSCRRSPAGDRARWSWRRSRCGCWPSACWRSLDETEDSTRSGHPRHAPPGLLELQVLQTPLEPEFRVAALAMGWNQATHRLIVEAHADPNEFDEVPDLESDTPDGFRRAPGATDGHRGPGVRRARAARGRRRPARMPLLPSATGARRPHLPTRQRVPPLTSAADLRADLQQRRCGSGRFAEASNLTLLARDRRRGRLRRTSLIAGERPLWDFPTGTLRAARWRCTMLAAALGLGPRPGTGLRADGPHGPGVCQRSSTAAASRWSDCCADRGPGLVGGRARRGRRGRRGHLGPPRPR